MGGSCYCGLAYVLVRPDVVQWVLLVGLACLVLSCFQCQLCVCIRYVALMLSPAPGMSTCNRQLACEGAGLLHRSHTSNRTALPEVVCMKWVLHAGVLLFWSDVSLPHVPHSRVLTLFCREFNLVSYTLLLSLIEFKTLVMRDQLSDALGLLPNIPTGDDGLVA